MSSRPDAALPSVPDFLAGGGEMGALIRAHHWSSTPLGPPEAWPPPLKTAVRLILNTGHPMYIWWGPDLLGFYNDAYRRTLGPERHPGSLGEPGREVWAEIWHLIGHQVDFVMAGRGSTWDENRLVGSTRFGRLDEIYWTYSYSPIDDETAPGGVGGVLVVCAETTEAVLAERRQAFRLALDDRLRNLADPEAVMTAAVTMLGEHIGAERVGYGEVLPDDATVRLSHCYASGVEPLLVYFPLDGFGPASIAKQRRGQTEACADVQADRDRDPAVWKAIDTRAFISVPLVREGRFRASLYVNSREPRRWSAEDVALVEDVATRTWDAVERARSEAGLRESEARLRGLNETLEGRVAELAADRDRMWRLSRDPFVVCDAEGRWLSASPAWTDILGWTEAELIGRTSEWMEHPDDRRKTRDKVVEVSAGEVMLDFTNRFRDRAGQLHWFSWTAVAEGNRLFCVARDVTGEKARQAELSAAQEALRQSQKLEALGQLTGGVAHDFNNLLTIIRSSADLLRRRELPEEKRRRYVDAISDTADRAARLTSQLLAFARRQALKAEVFDAAARVEGIADILRTVLGPCVEMAIDAPREACFVEADPGQFETALVNAGVNARDAMDGEGVLTITIKAVDALPPVQGQARACGEFVAVSVSDTGCGIAPEHLERIFEPFFTTKDIGKGTGLGLSQVFGFTKQTGGDVTVASSVGKGTTLTLYLPRADATRATAAAAESNDERTDGRGRVLVVEDNADVGEFAAQLLEDLGYEVEFAPNAAEALRLLEAGAGPFNVVFSDVVMPGMGGVELGRRLRERWPELPVVLTSGYSHVLAGDARHGFPLLHKPYSVEGLSRVLRQATAGGG